MDIKIIVAENEDGLLQEIGKSLLTLGLDVILAKNGLEAINKFNEHKAEIIVSSIEMPILSGIGLLKYFKILKFNRPIIFIMSDSSSPSKDELIKLGATDAIQKPFKTEELIQFLFTRTKK